MGTSVVGGRVGGMVGADVSLWHRALQRKYQRPSLSQSLRQDSRPSQQGISSPVFHGSPLSFVHVTGSDGDGVGTDAAGEVGLGVGATVGDAVGAKVGAEVGAGVGADVGADVGDAVGADVRAGVGANVGAEVGTEVGADVCPWHRSLQRKYQRPLPSQSLRQASRPSQQNISLPFRQGSSFSCVHVTGGCVGLGVGTTMVGAGVSALVGADVGAEVGANVPPWH